MKIFPKHTALILCMRLRRHSELATVAASPCGRKRLRKFSETPQKKAARSERTEEKRCEREEGPSERASSEQSGESSDLIASESEWSNNSLSFYANAERELFYTEKETFVEISAERNFTSYLEYVAYALGAREVSADELGRYSAVVRKFEKEVFTKRDAALGRWPKEMREAIEKFPALQISREAYAPGTLCQACNRKGDTVVEGMLTGPFYQTENFLGSRMDIKQATQLAVKEFMITQTPCKVTDDSVYLTLSAHCAKKVEQYHRFHHWKWRVFQAVYRWLREHRKAEYHSASDVAVLMKNDSSFLARMHQMNDQLFGTLALSD